MVLIDIEWVKNKNEDFCLSQVAAVKLDADLSVTDKYATIVKPLNSSFQNWSQEGYSGWKPNDFLHARTSNVVILDFVKWIGEDHCLLFWDEEVSEKFEKFFDGFLFADDAPQITILNPYFAYVLSEKKVYRMDQYQVANHLNSPSGLLKHNALNDVDTILLLFEKQKLTFEFLSSSAPAIEKEESISDEPKPIELLPYQIDTDEKVLHKAGCPLFNMEHHRKGYHRIEDCLRKQIKACPECIGEELAAARRAYNGGYLTRKKINYVYLPESNVFHRPTCSRALSAPVIRTLNTYKRCMEKGLIPCPKCKPEPEYLQVDEDDYEARLTPAEQNALARHRQINLEREAALQSGFSSDTERNDMYTLTQPEYSFWAGKGYKTFHIRTCAKLSDARNLIGFRKYSDALRAHYVPCKYCKPSSNNNVVVSIPIQNERRENDTIEDLKQLCAENGFIFKDEKTTFFIITPIGFWKINVYSMPIQVHHLSLKHNNGSKLHYHKQPRVFLSYKDLFDYILRHDNELIELVARKKIFVEPKIDVNGVKQVLCPLCQKFISNDACYEISCNADGMGTVTGVPGLISREEIDAGARVCQKCMYH